MTCIGAGAGGECLLTCENEELDISHKSEPLQTARACAKSGVSQ